jgi:catechol 2,3-dioxygenase-like lactoylglutathione lyase family enzyme
MKSKIDHIAILVDDLREAEAWYSHHMCAEVAFRDQKYIRLRVENTNIALIDNKYYPHAHVGILVENFEDLPTEQGMTVHHRDGAIGVYVEDPFGNYLEYIWYSDEQKEVFLDD